MKGNIGAKFVAKCSKVHTMFIDFYLRECYNEIEPRGAQFKLFLKERRIAMMKRKILAVVLAACMCAGTGMLLSSCGSHTFKTDWEKDATHHWHACEDAGCGEVSEKAEHTFDEGQITTEATDTAQGVKTYTCTVCKQTKTEAVTFNGLSLSQYGAATETAAFQNVTVTQEGTETVDGETVSTFLITKLDGGKYSQAGTAAGQVTEAEEEDAESTGAVRTALLFFTAIKHSQLTYNADTKIYTAAADCQIAVTDNDGVTRTYKDFKLTFTGSQVSTVEAAYTVDNGAGSTGTGTLKLTFAAYGTTAVAQLLYSSTYAEVVDFSNFGNVTLTEKIGDGSAVTVMIDSGNVSGGGYPNDPDVVISSFSFLTEISSAKYTYDAASDTYVASGVCYEKDGVRIENVRIGLASDDSDTMRLVSLEYDVVSGSVTQHRAYTFTAYGSTVVEEPNSDGDGDQGNNGDNGDNDDNDDNSGIDD